MPDDMTMTDKANNSPSVASGMSSADDPQKLVDEALNKPGEGQPKGEKVVQDEIKKVSGLQPTIKMDEEEVAVESSDTGKPEVSETKAPANPKPFQEEAPPLNSPGVTMGDDTPLAFAGKQNVAATPQAMEQPKPVMDELPTPEKSEAKENEVMSTSQVVNKSTPKFPDPTNPKTSNTNTPPEMTNQASAKTTAPKSKTGLIIVGLVLFVVMMAMILILR